jgi:hypothetical protein
MQKIQRVKIEYDGQGPAWKARVTNADTGELIPGVYKATINFDCSKDSLLAILHTRLPVVNITVDAEIHTHCPYCGHEVNDGKETE